MQNEKIKMQISKWKENILLNLHFSFCNLQFAIKFSGSFQNAKLLSSSSFSGQRQKDLAAKGMTLVERIFQG